MYRQQQPPPHYSQHDSYHVRQPESTLFEDSPQNADSYEVDPNLRLQQLYQRNLANPPNAYNQRVLQSEESGGGMIMTSDGGRPDDEDREETPDREGDSDIEFIIMNLYSKMKNLEGKYIDLANFYKQELVKTSTFKKAPTDEDPKPHYRMATGQGITPSKSFERSVDMNLDQSPGKISSGRGEMPSEREIIRDLIEEKKKVWQLSLTQPDSLQLEDDMKQMITMKGSHLNFQQSPSLKDQVSDFQTNTISSEQASHMKAQLQEAIRDVVEKIDQTQKQELQVLTQKQNEMYTLATRYNLPSNIRNESLGLWYDAKTKISACMESMKFQIQNKQKDLSAAQQKPKIRSKENRVQEESDNTGLSSKVIADLQREVALSRRKMEQQSKQILSLKKGFNFQEVSLKEDQNKIHQLIKDIQESLMNFEKKDHLLLSGEKSSSQNLMSPFQKRIVSYQKSAEMRKQGEVLNRSGSRGRPVGLPVTTSTGTNFYQSRDYMNPQIMPSSQQYQNPVDNMESQDQETIRYIKSKLRNMEYTLEDIGSKSHIKQQEQKDMDATLDSLLQDQLAFFKQIDSILTKTSHGQSSLDMDMSANTRGTIREKSKNRGGFTDHTPNPHYGPTSPNKQNESGNNFYTGQRQNLQEKKISELQRNNDSLFLELRKANEKYLNQRVDNNKLKDEIQILQNALQESNLQMKKQQQQILEANPMGQAPLQRQSIKKKIQATSQRVDSHIPMSVTSQSMGGGRQPSNNSILMVKENEDLKRKVQELEKECFTLTYYQQEMQRRGGPNNNSNSDPYLRGILLEKEEMKGKIEQMCLKVQRFMFAMKRLQRAVNNKDKDIQIYKGEFEMNKKQLEQLVKDTKEQMDNKQNSSNNSKQNNSSMMGQQIPQPSNHHSMMATWDKRDQRFEEPGRINTGGGQRNRSQAPHAQGNTFHQARNSRDQQNQQYPASQRNEEQPFTGERLRQKKPSHQEQFFNDTNSLENHQQQQQQLKTSPSQEYQFNKVLEEVRLMQEESDKQKKHIEELKQLNEDLLADKNTLDVQLKSKSINSQKLSQQLKASSDTISRQDLLLNDYKEALMQLELNPNLNKKVISKTKTDLLMKERDLIHHQLNQDSNRQQKMMSGTASQRDLHQELKLSQQIQQSQITQLREELMQQIQEKEEGMERHFEELNTMLQEKEEDINRVKKLFVEKLREIENSFVEISQEMVENEQIQQEASRKMQNQNQVSTSQFQNQKHDLEKSIDQVIGKYEDEQREEELNQLIEANEELLNQNSLLGRQVKELEQQIQQLTRSNDREEEFYTLKQQNEHLEEQVREIRNECSGKDKVIEEFQVQKKAYDAKIKEFNQTLKQQENKYQQFQTEAEEYIDNLDKQLKQEKEQRILFESEHNNKDKAYRQIKSDMKVLSTENDLLKTSSRDLKAQIDNLLSEQEYVKQITAGKEGKESEEIGIEPVQFNDEQENLKIESNPKESALSYFRMLKATNKELAICQKAKEKLETKFNDQKEKMDDLKQESRESFEQQLNMENQIFELQRENENLKNEIVKHKGSSQVDEASIKQQIEEHFKDQLAFKDSEIESSTIKLARLANSNAEFQQKQVRLEAANQELYAENELNRHKIQSLEMELEMTKSNSERDLDQLIEQEQQKQLIDKAKFESDKAKLQAQVNEQIKKYDQVKQELEEKINKKKEKLSQFKTQNQELSNKQREGGLVAEALKKGFEQKLKDLQKQISEEQEARDESERLRQVQQVQQEKEIEDLKKEQEKQKQDLILKYQKELDKEKSKLGNVAQTSSERELQLKQQHQEELDELEERLLVEREALEQDLQNKEKAKLDQLKKQTDHERQVLLKQKEEEQLLHLKQLKEANEQEQLRLQEEYEEERKQLEQVKKQELDMIEAKLKSELKDKETKSKKQLSLIQVLQSKARDALIQEINNQKHENELQRQQEKESLRKAISEHEALLKHMENEKHQELQSLQEKLEAQRVKDLSVKENEKTLALKMQEKIRDDLQKSIDQQQQVHAQEIEVQRKELERLKHEQDELVKSMSQQQDQQTQELLAQKEREIEELLRKSKEDQVKYDKEVKTKDLNLRQMKEEHEQVIADLNIKQAQLISSKENEIQQLQSQQKKVVQDLKDKLLTEEEKYQNQLKILKEEQEELIKYKDKEIEKLSASKKQESEQALARHKQQMDQIYANCEKELEEKDIMINDLNDEIQNNKLLIDQLTLSVKSLQKDKDAQIKQKEEDLRVAKAEHAKLVEELNESKQSDLETLQKKLSDDHTQSLKKIDQERSLFEKMQDRIRKDLADQLQEQEREKLEKQKVIESLESEIQSKEKDMEKERVDQQELIDQLNISMRQVGQQKITLEKENDKMRKELDTLKKQQQESEKELIRDLREKLKESESQYENIFKDKQQKDSEIASLKQHLKEKQTEIQNLEKDLDQFVKENEDEKQQNEADFEQVTLKLKEITKQKELLEKERKEGELQFKMKEALLKQLEEKITEHQQSMMEKDSQIERLEETKSHTQKSQEKQIKDLQKKHQEEIQRLEEEKTEIQLQIQGLLSQNQHSSQVNQSIDEIEQKLSQFEIDLQKVKRSNKALEKQRQLNDSLLDNIQKDGEEEVIGDLCSNQNLQYCKRVKFLDKAWILVNRESHYYWIDQENIPIEKIQRINVDSLEETQGKLQQRLDELNQEKENLIKLLQVQDSNRSDKARSDSQKAIILTNENQELKHQLHDLELQNNQLQQNNLQLKQKIKELNDMIFGLTDTEKNHDSVKKIYDFQIKNEDLSSKLLKQYQISKELEEQVDHKNTEIDKLRKQLLDADQSFLKAGNQNNNSMIAKNFPLGISGIDQQDSFDGDGNEDGQNSSKVQRLETEIEEFQKINVELEKLNKTLKHELNEIKKNQSSGQQQVNDYEIQEQLKHIRSILIKFLEKTPITTIENEALLPIIYSMMLFTKEEINMVQKSRQTTSEQNVKGQTKKGVFGMFGGKGAGQK